MSLYETLPLFAQNWACTWAGYQRSRTRFTREFHHRLAELERSIALPRERLEGIQWERLQAMVRHARQHVPYYSSLAPPSIENHHAADSMRETLASIPPLEKEVYRERAGEFLAGNLDPGRLIRGKTSGTTGTALPLWYTPASLAEEFATVWRGMRQAGARLTDPNLTFNGQIIVPFRQERPPFWRHNRWSRQTLFSLYHCKPEHLPHYVDAVHDTPAAFVQGYPSGMHLVGRAMLAAGRPLPPGRLVACFTSSESLLAFQRETIEAAFGAPVYDRYGVSEFCVSMTQCSERNLHVDMEFGIVEIEVTEESEDWVRGPLLVTGFANEATPLLRYRVGDIGTRAKAPCPCGRAGDVFLDVDGRIEDYVVTPDGRLVGRLDHIFKEQLDVAEAQVLQDTPQALDVLVVPGLSYDEGSERRLLNEFRSRLGDEIAIRLRYVDSIPREPNGKLRAVKSRTGRLS